MLVQKYVVIKIYLTLIYNLILPLQNNIIYAIRITISTRNNPTSGEIK